MSSKYLNDALYGAPYGLRPGTKLKRWRVHFVFNTGGMGDFVNYAGATHWLAKHAPWLVAKVFVPKYLVELFKDIHAHNRDWQVYPSEEFGQHKAEGMAMIGPDIHINGVNISHQFLNCVGAHPFDVGFGYYASTTPPPIGAELPVLDYPKENLHPKVKELDGNYVVVPTGNVHESRKTTGKHLNQLILYILSHGLTPVFLGKRDLIGNGQVHVTFADDIEYNLGLDLRDQTSVKEAACILQHAKATVALDCGLLHLAALMKDSRIVFGYNVTSIAHREPRRSHGKHVNVTLTEGELKCIGCQSKLKQIAIHKFDKCLYGDTKCVDLLFANNAKKFRDALDEVLFDKIQH